MDIFFIISQQLKDNIQIHKLKMNRLVLIDLS